jgi:hypothetical protein
MLHPNKIMLKSLFIMAVFLFPVLEVAAGDLPEQIAQLENQILDTNKKIATLALEQDKNITLINALRTSLSKAHQEINEMNNSRALKTNLYAVNAGVRRTANGHGRGGR